MRMIMTGLFLVALLSQTALAQSSGAGACYAYLEEIYNRFEKPLQDYLIAELEQFLALFPDSDHAGDALYLLGRSLENRKKPHLALAAYAKLAFLYPGHGKRGPALESLREILAGERAYKAQSDHLVPMVEDAALAGARSDRHYAYLEFLAKLDAGKLHARVLAEHLDFKRAYPLEPRLAYLDLWAAVSWANKGRSRESALAFRKFEVMHPGHPSLPYARYTRAELLTRDLGEHDMAATILKALVVEMPENKYAPKALFLLGEVQDRRLKEPRAAIATYRHLLGEYRESGQAADALLAVAEIQEKRLNVHADAVESLREFADHFPRDPRVSENLEQAGSLQERRLKHFAAAAESYTRAAAASPDSDRAVGLLLRAGKLHEEKTGDLDAAEALYRRGLENYPGSSKQGELQKRLRRIQERRGG